MAEHSVPGAMCPLAPGDYGRMIGLLTHECCKGTPLGLCAAHEQQGRLFMAELNWNCLLYTSPSPRDS